MRGKEEEELRRRERAKVASRGRASCVSRRTYRGMEVESRGERERERKREREIKRDGGFKFLI